MIEFFENLKQKRIENGIDLGKVAKKTLLNLNILNFIENGEIDKLPKGYRRIYLRRYVKEIGLNPDEVMKDYNLLIGDTDVELMKETVTKKAEVKKSSWQHNISREKIVHFLSVAMIIIVIISTIAIIYFVTKYLNESENYDIKEISVETMAAMEDSTLKITNGVDSLVPVTITNEKKDDYFTFFISVKENCWIRQIVDFRDTTEYILKRGRNKKISAKNRVRFIAGNGNAVVIKHNDKTYEDIAPKGSILRRLVIDKDGIAENIYMFPEKKKPEETDSLITE